MIAAGQLPPEGDAVEDIQIGKALRKMWFGH
jgi:hypothetical protein